MGGNVSIRARHLRFFTPAREGSDHHLRSNALQQHRAIRGASYVKLHCEISFFDSCFSTFPGVRGHTVLVLDSFGESSWDRASNRMFTQVRMRSPSTRCYTILAED